MRKASSRWRWLGAILVPAAAGALVTPAAAGAQASLAERDARLEALIVSLEPGRDLRIVTTRGQTYEGALLSATTVGVELSAQDLSRTIPYYEVRDVAGRSGHGVQGALWGFGGGALAGVFFGAMYASFDCRTAEACNYTERQGAVRWGTFLGLVGGGIGFYVGRRQVHWHPIFP